MDEPDSPERSATFEIRVPPELEAGAYSNFLSVWHTPSEFTLDFAVTQPVELVEPNNPNSSVRVPCRVVARVKIPPRLIFSILQSLNENMTKYEASFGEIVAPSAEGKDPR
jgi:hypothetical protein